MCSYDQVQRYRARISGPLLDRIDVHVLVDAVPYRDYARRGSGEPSHVVRNRVVQAHQAQEARLGCGRVNASMTQAELRRHVALGEESMQLVECAIDEHGLSTRAVGRVLKVARTIADLSAERAVSHHHVDEALRFRVLDRGAHTNPHAPH
jgi:magnesium chelatase family protein